MRRIFQTGSPLQPRRRQTWICSIEADHMKWFFLKGKLARTFCFLAVAALPIPSALAQSATEAKLLVTSPVVATQTVTLAGNLRAEANAQNDRGAAVDGLL